MTITIANLGVSTPVLLKDTASIAFPNPSVISPRAWSRNPMVIGTGLFADGTAAAPSISFLTDPDTGIYRPSSNSVGVAVAGAELARFTAAGLGIGVTPTVRLQVEESATAAASYFLHRNSAANNVANSVQWVVQLDTTVSARNAFIVATSFNNVTDATRNSLVQFYGQNAGALTEVMRFDGTKIGVSGPIYRNSPMEKVQYGGGVVSVADTFLAMKEGTVSVPSTVATYSKPMFYFERHTNNATKGTYADWGNQRMSPAGLIEVISYGLEQGCPTALALRSYTDWALPTQAVTSITRSGATATAVTTTSHNLATGDTVIVFDAVQTEYNGSRTVTVPTFSVTSLTSAGVTATATTSVAHGLATNDWVVIAGASPAGYNGIVQITVTGASTFTYTLAGALSSPATGTITATADRIFTYTVAGAPATPATGTILVSSAQPMHGLAVLAQANPAVSGGTRNREVFAGNFICSFPSGTKPPNFVGIEVDLIPSQSCANVRPGTGNGDNFTAVWAQSAGGGYTNNTAFYASANGSGGWFYGMVLDCNFHDTVAYLRNTLDGANTGLRVELARNAADGYPIRAFANAGAREQFRVDAGSADAVWVLVNSTLKQLVVGAADSAGAGFRAVRVTN